MSDQTFSIHPIGVIHTPFKQKLGIPRQPGLAPSSLGTIKLRPEYAREDTLRELETFDYLWIHFWCHLSQSWRETVKPPRLGGKDKVGVFATRSPHRPNPIGLSVVKLEKVTKDFSIIVSDIDLADQTPIIDIKPYIPLWDSKPEAKLGWIERQPHMPSYQILWGDDIDRSQYPETFTMLLEETLRWNPRPSFEKSLDRTYTHTVDNYDVTWTFTGDCIRILAIT